MAQTRGKKIWTFQKFICTTTFIKESLQVTFIIDEKWWWWENNIYKLNPIYFNLTESTENFWLFRSWNGYIMFWNTILLLLNKTPHGIPVLQNDWILWGWLAWFNLCRGLPRRLRVLRLTPTVCESLSDWSRRKTLLRCSVSAYACMFEAFEEET